nr:flagellar basal body P-ring formation chaperone FlgA [Szabonella alba]
MAGPSGAGQSLVATRTIRAQTVLAPQDMALVAAVIPGALTQPEAAIGLEARVTLYAGRAIRGDDLAPPALVDRNGIVTLVYRQGGLDITAEGRALDRGARGARIRVMNLTSRMTITGRIGADGTVHVGPDSKEP